MKRRLSIFLIIFVLVLFGPYFIYLPLIALTLWLIPLWWEGILLGFIVDTLYGLDRYSWIEFPFPVALGAAILLIIFVPLRERIRLGTH